MVNKDAALPPLRLVFKDKTKEHVTYVTEPKQVAYDPNFERDVIGFFKTIGDHNSKKQGFSQTQLTPRPPESDMRSETSRRPPRLDLNVYT